MNVRERGFLLLTSHLGDPERKPLTTAQLRFLALHARLLPEWEKERDLTVGDLIRIGCGTELAEATIRLLSQEDLLDAYLLRGKSLNCTPLCRAGREYPQLLRGRLGLDSPGCLWGRGDLSLLHTPTVSLVGSRDLSQPNLAFAEEVGRQAALQGWTLVSGNARGADRAAQESCLRHGGAVISIVADCLNRYPRRNMLYLSEDGFDEAFTAQRALSRNRCIHALGRVVFVAQAQDHRGGTWDGTVKNLHYGWSPVLCFRDGSEASLQLEQQGAQLIDVQELSDFSRIRPIQNSLW